MQVRLPIPRLGGKLKRVCRECTIILAAQPSLDDEDARLQQQASAAAQVDRAVRARHLAAVRTDSPFRPPADVADQAEDDGHPFAQRIA